VEKIGPIELVILPQRLGRVVEGIRIDVYKRKTVLMIRMNKGRDDQD